MIKEYKTIQIGGCGEVIEKKSKFIANTGGIESEEEALRFIEKIKKQHWNARHHCFAYVLGERDEIQRYSDDGEPSTTAGKPILEVLKGAKIHNTIIVVTRYFGGTLLGTGGLVRAYSSAAKEGLSQSEIIIKRWGKKVIITTDYLGISKIQHILKQKEIPVLETAYTEVVTIEVVLPVEEVKVMVEEITKVTCGKGIVEEIGECYFTKKEAKTVMF